MTAVHDNIEAERLVWKATLARNRELGRPDPGSWVGKNIQMNSEESKSGWLVEGRLLKPWPLAVGEFWESRSDGSKILVYEDPKTCERSVIISYHVDAKFRVVLFRAEIQRANGDCRIEELCDLSTLVRSDYHLS